MGFETPQPPLSDYLKWATSGYLQLPDFSVAGPGKTNRCGPSSINDAIQQRRVDHGELRTRADRERRCGVPKLVRSEPQNRQIECLRAPDSNRQLERAPGQGRVFARSSVYSG